MTQARYIVGDVHDVLAALPDASVDLVLTSPPFLALRSYLPADHPDKVHEIGSEATPEAFIDTLLDVVEACDRVLAPHGSIAFELGDTYSGSGGAGGDYNADGLRAGQQRFNGSGRRAQETRSESGWPQPKSLTLIPESFRWALAYGRNPHNGRETAPWKVRNVVRWCRPNPPVGALADKYRPATSEMVIACKSKDRWFDLDAVREPYIERRASRGSTVHGGRTSVDQERKPRAGEDYLAGPGAPPLDWWPIPTQPYKGAHYATWPERLCVVPILSMCPLHVCTVCGEPRRRIAETVNAVSGAAPRHDEQTRRANAADTNAWKSQTGATATERRTVGWSDCGHDTWRRGVVLDPFAGSGTTLKVATGQGRDAIGIDLDGRNVGLAVERVGPMFLTVEQATVSP